MLRFLFVVCYCIAVAAGAFGQYNQPESVVYDPAGDRYFVSNNGNGTLMEIDSEATVSTWATGLNAPAGLTINGNKLYAASSRQIRAYHLEDGTLDTAITISIAGYLNDIISDEDYLYITDSNRGRIYRMELETCSYTTLVSGLTNPNGVEIDSLNSRLLVCTMPTNAPILEISLPGGEVSTLVVTPYAVLDGITHDGRGNVYVSSHYVAGMGGTNSIYRYDISFTEPEDTVSTGHPGAADIHYNIYDDILAIPNMSANTVDFLDLSGTSVSPTGSAVPTDHIIGLPYPNPFNPSITIPMTLTDAAPVEINIYDLLGRQVDRLDSGILPPGLHRLNWTASACGSGTYYLDIAAGDVRSIRKVVLMR